LINKALIVEPDSDFCALMESALSHRFSGIRIQSLKTVKNLVLNSDFDIALVSLTLPGEEAYAIIRQLDQKSCYCIATSEYNHAPPMTKALQAGARGYLLKGHSSIQIVNMLANIETVPPISPEALKWLVKHFQESTRIEAAPLTAREKEVLNLIATGYKLSDVALRLGISRHTCADYVKNIYKKLNISSRAEVALAASRLELI